MCTQRTNCKHVFSVSLASCSFLLSSSFLLALNQTLPFIATLVGDDILGEGDLQDNLGVKSAQETRNPLWPLLKRTQSIRMLLGSNSDVYHVSEPATGLDSDRKLPVIVDPLSTCHHRSHRPAPPAL